MGVYFMCFSPTGGTKKVMEILAGEWKEVTWVDLTKPGKDYSRYLLEKADICVVGVPSYGGRVPAPALERIAQMQGGRARTAAVVVYGNRAYDDTLLELKEKLEEREFHVGAAAAAVAEHSIMRQFGTGRPDEQDKKELEEFARKIRISLENKETEELLKVPGSHPYREYNGVPMKPKAGRTCTKCRTCAALCPVSAIPEDNPERVEKEKCISCMRCISVCPVHARKVSGLLLFFAGKSMKKSCGGRKENELYIEGAEKTC